MVEPLPPILCGPRERAARLGAAVYYGGLRTLRVPAIRRQWGAAAVILCYHNVVASNDPVAGAPGLHVDADRFARQVKWLSDHYDIVSLREFIRQRSIRTSPPLAAITFDDGYAGVFQHAAPLLDRLGIPATVFVVSEASSRSAPFWWDHPQVTAVLTDARRERWLRTLRGDEAAILSDVRGVRAALPDAYRAADWGAIRACATRRMDVGVHSATHRYLPALSDRELEQELVASRTVIHRETGVWPEYFAYPYGLCDTRVRAAVRSAGYTAAFGLNPGLESSADDPWMLPRVNIPSGISDSAFEAWTAGLH